MADHGKVEGYGCHRPFCLILAWIRLAFGVFGFCAIADKTSLITDASENSTVVSPIENMLIYIGLMSIVDIAFTVTLLIGLYQNIRQLMKIFLAYLFVYTILLVVSLVSLMWSNKEKLITGLGFQSLSFGFVLDVFIFIVVGTYHGSFKPKLRDSSQASKV